MYEQDLLIRSKSYDSQFNELISDISDKKDSANVVNEKPVNSEQPLAQSAVINGNSNNNNDSEQTTITITSFAPIPASADLKSRAATNAWKIFNNSSPTSYESHRYLGLCFFFLEFLYIFII